MALKVDKVNVPDLRKSHVKFQECNFRNAPENAMLMFLFVACNDRDK